MGVGGGVGWMGGVGGVDGVGCRGPSVASDRPTACS